MQQLLPGTTCDGEAVTWRGGRIDFGAVQARAASSLDRPAPWPPARTVHAGTRRGRAGCRDRSHARRVILCRGHSPGWPVVAVGCAVMSDPTAGGVVAERVRVQGGCGLSNPVNLCGPSTSGSPDGAVEAQDPARGHDGRAGGRLRRAPPPPAPSRGPPGRGRPAPPVRATERGSGRPARRASGRRPGRRRAPYRGGRDVHRLVIGLVVEVLAAASGLVSSHVEVSRISAQSAPIGHFGSCGRCPGSGPE